MALMSCVGLRAHESLLDAVEEAVKDSSAPRLHSLLSDGQLTAKELTYRNILHQAAWLGHTGCVKLLLDHGVLPDEPHRKNGCTPLHLAHFCTIEDHNAGRTIRTLVAAGANINNPGGKKCGKIPIYHAIQHQRLDSVKVLLSEGALVRQESLFLSIDVGNSQILELLLMHGGDCAQRNPVFWGEPLTRLLQIPIEGCTRDAYKRMFRLLVQASVCTPYQRLPHLTIDDEFILQRLSRRASARIKMELRGSIPFAAAGLLPLVTYLLTYLVRNGYRPPVDLGTDFVSLAIDGMDWANEYLRNPPSLKELSVRTVRSYLVYSHGNVIYGVEVLHLPARLKNLILMITV